MPTHPLVRAAADGRLPRWAVAGPRRREHIERVAELLDSWAERAGLGDDERARWRAVAYLHDALRDAPPEELRKWVDEPMPDALLHGPAAAARLRREGVDDEELLDAIANHTVGAPTFSRLGRALYAADFLEPGRTFLPELRAELRARAPEDLDRVVRDVTRERIGDLERRGKPIHPRTEAFWDMLVRELGE
ncbi:MAG: HD domain-containing protein [Gemmatimonadota bacterium]